jgi:hypothetical protein
VDDDLVSIGRSPESCPLHSAAPIIAAPAAPAGTISISFTRPPQN